MTRLLLTIALLTGLTVSAQQPARSYGDLGNGFYLNPILSGEYPDPTILRDGRDYYMTHTSLNNYPGLLIWHSTDLVSWRPVAHALTKSIGEIWAPDLCKFKGRYYIYFPARDTRSTMVVYADQITGPWSDPVEMKIGHIDPGHVVGSDGKRYLYFSDGNIVQLSDDGLSVAGKVKPVYEGWKYPDEWLTECFCLESPKLFKRGKYFYLVSAQGGTAGPATSHMAVAARSKSVTGPWENSPYNPIIHTYDYSEKWWSKGHATMIDTPEGDWYLVYHAFLNNFRTLGRMTLLEPVEWTPEGWFRVAAASDPAKPIKMPQVKAIANEPMPEKVKGFSEFDWHAFRAFEPDRYDMSPEALTIKGRGAIVSESDPLQFTPGHAAYQAAVKVERSGTGRQGFMIWYGQQFYRGIEVAADSIGYFTEKRSVKVAAVKPGSPVFIRIKNDSQALDLQYSFDGNRWERAWDAADISPYTGNLLGNFRSLKVALFSYGEGSARFSEFRYEPLTRTSR